jgi:tRNA (cytidine/uridine-2'-O-)-methyltransferase
VFHVILFQPEIPPNTGNVIRMCANSGATLHLVKPLGFEITAATLRRAGMDYAELTHVQTHENWQACLTALGSARLFALSTRNARNYTEAQFSAGDAFLFGSETSGLPKELLEAVPEEQRLRLPMRPNNRSLNLSNTVAIVVYEAWRQLGFAGGE